MIIRMPSRRAVLRGLTAYAALGAARVGVGRARALHVGVVGAGVLGSSIAFHLAEAGARVTVFEKRAPAGGATQNSFGFINMFERDAHYQKLRVASVEAYRRLDIPLDLGITWGGYLNWASTTGEADEAWATAVGLEGTPYAVRRIGAVDVRRLSPGLEPGPIEAAFYSPFAGHVDPVPVTRRLLEAAQRHGATLRSPCEVLRIEMQGARLAGVHSAQGHVALDRLVIAAGVETPMLLTQVDYRMPLRHAPGILAHSVPLESVTQLVCDGPDELEFKQTSDARLVGEWHFEPPDLPQHAEIRAQAMDFTDGALRAAHGRRILDRIATFVPGARGVALERLTLGFRPMPRDGFPIVGPAPTSGDVYMAVTHSGVTLAPILGKHVATEVLGDGVAAEALAPYRPTRFSA
jgi:glycine/D-amino acid oxidase-like deaminating enzyme